MDNPPSTPDPEPPGRMPARNSQWRVVISRGTVRGRVPRSVLADTAARVCRGERLRGEVHLIVVGDREIRRLNKRFLGQDRATDVLSFPIEESSPRRRADTLVGEVYCNLDHARRWSRETGDTQSAELARLTVHGILHLMGYDHHTPKERQVMRRKENRYLAAAGLISTRTGNGTDDAG